MRYKGKTDWSISVGLLVGIAAPAYIAITQNIPWMSVASVFAALLFFGISYPQWYEATPDGLLIRSGMTTRIVAYPRMRAIRAVSGRLAVVYDTGSLMIGPQNAEGLMAEIAAHAPQLARSGTDLVAQ